MNYNIRPCKKEDSEVLAMTIRKSFQNVAERFGLTAENAPRHSSNCTVEWIQKDMARGAIYFIIENEGSAAGCAALEQASSEVCYLERLAVLPEYRQRGFGKALVTHLLLQAELLGVHFVKIAIIAGHTELKTWYERIGFVEEESKEFSHLPFRVTFLSCKLENVC
ncbi:MAG: GNAT family N-acetyltransferase [Deltaproteobacteria bacterium HGW-Deltaproteobacteria-12]|jgi:N-acetylglutamate synthase-like GNAT family acetyltransferase|nr:MAG: GNAT family N-acetyltransferase [Deltaproteobacteria bacterium HGW-Deltaproteobacteria-12]